MNDVDDEELGALFRAAASDPGAPAPGFDHAAVVRASRRATVRRRAALTGTGLALLAVVGIGTSLVLPDRSGEGDAATVAAPMIAPGPDEGARPEPDRPADPGAQPFAGEPAEPPAQPDAGEPGQARAQPEAAAPADPGAPDAAAPAEPKAPDAAAPAEPEVRREGPPSQAEGGPGAAPAPDAADDGPPPLGPATGECAERQDPALRALVEEVLPEVVGALEAATTTECRPGGGRGVHVEVRDGAASGLLSVRYVPPGGEPEQVEGAVDAPTASGGTVVLSSRPDKPDGAAPLADRLSEAASYLAPRL